MTTTILQAPVSAGKTEAALDRLMAVIQASEPRLARVWVLLATRRQEYAFRQRLVERDAGRSVYSNVEFFSYYELNRRLLNLTGRTTRQLDDATRRGLLRHLLRTMQQQGELQTLGDVELSPGFLRMIGGFIHELKENLVHPEAFDQAVALLAAAGGKDRDLALIYRRYQAALHDHQLADQDGEGWLALEALRQGPLPLRVDLLLVDGFDQFTPAQAALLVSLSAQTGATIITLTTVPGREHSIGQRFERARNRLMQAYSEAGVPLAQERLSSQSNGQRSPDLVHLEQTILQPEARQAASQGAVKFLEAPEPVEEAAEISRRIKRLLLDGTAPDDIVIVLRDWERYAPCLATYQQRYGLPYRFHNMPPHTANPALSILLRVLQLHSSGFRQRDLLDVLRSPYIGSGLSTDDIEKLDAISQRYQITRGRHNWLNAVGAACHTMVDSNGKTIAPILTPEAATRISAQLERFFDGVTPPPTGTIWSYVAWLEQLIGEDGQPDPDDDDEVEHVSDGPLSLNIPTRIRQVEDDPELAHLFNRDMVALNALMGALNGLLSANALVSHTLASQPETRSWRGFFHELSTALQQQPDEPANAARNGQVLVTTVTDARGLPHAHVFIPGLSEGLFPQKLSEDPVYLDSERQRFQAVGVPLLTQNERSDDDSLFFELINLARQTLTLSRPTVRDGSPWPASHLWRATWSVFADDSHDHASLTIGAAPTPAQAADLSEALLSAAAGLMQQPLTDAAAGLVAWLQADAQMAEQWAQVRRSRRLEQSRLSPQGHDRYSGRISHPELVAMIAAELGPERRWSASQLNELGRCGGFYFFADRLLGLNVLKEPSDEPDTLQLGTLRHDILEVIYTRIKDDGLSIDADNLERALMLAEESARQILHDAPERYGFPQPVLWDELKTQITEQIRALVTADFDNKFKLKLAGEHRRPALLERGFGMTGQAPQLDLGDPVGSIYLRGLIDRIDQTDTAAVVIDYKSGSTKIRPDDLSDGVNFQMLVYMEGARWLSQQEAGLRAADSGVFWSMSKLESLGKLDLSDEAHQEAIASGLAHLRRYIERARAGDFGVRPTPGGKDDDKCVGYCPYHELCRISATHHHKTQQETGAW